MGWLAIFPTEEADLWRLVAVAAYDEPLGDDGDGTFEWTEGSIEDCSDGRGDDVAEIVIPKGEVVRVGHWQQSIGR